MRRRKPPSRLTVKPLYTVGELAEVAGLDRYATRRMLERNGVEFVRSGRAVYVPLSEMREKLKTFWASVVESENLRDDVESLGPAPKRTG